MSQCVTVHMMMHSSVAPNTPEDSILGMLFQLREPDFKWLINWGCFKMAYTLVSHTGLFRLPCICVSNAGLSLDGLDLVHSTQNHVTICDSSYDDEK